jgi:hypothetical protein
MMFSAFHKMTLETTVDTSSHFVKNTFRAMTSILWCATMSEALADDGAVPTLAAPPATHSLMKPTNNRKCFCFWPNCQELHLEAIKKLPPSNHPWCQLILQAQCGNTNRSLALRHCIAHHLHLDENDKKKNSLYIHHHHLSLLGWRRDLKEF